MTSVLDASAILAFLQGEPGADVVEAQLHAGSRCGAANWSETAQRILSTGHDWQLARALLLSYDIEVDEVTADDAEWAAKRWARGSGLSLGDRLCLALAARLEADVWTADREWGSSAPVNQIR